MLHNLTPNYLSDLIPPLVQENNPYSLRNASDIRTIRAHSNLYFNSFLPSTIRAWNNLPDEIKQSASVVTFKNKLNRDRQLAPKYYKVGTRLGQILHARLRMECSSLNTHLFSKNIVNSPECVCGGFQSPYHFLYTCVRYTNIRNTYLSDILPRYTTNELLFGKETATSEENESLFLKVQEYIIKTKRFI